MVNLDYRSSTDLIHHFCASEPEQHRLKTTYRKSNMALLTASDWDTILSYCAPLTTSETNSEGESVDTRDLKGLVDEKGTTEVN
jgi:hypothetical protein